MLPQVHQLNMASNKMHRRSRRQTKLAFVSGLTIFAIAYGSLGGQGNLSGFVSGVQTRRNAIIFPSMGLIAGTLSAPQPSRSIDEAAGKAIVDALEALRQLKVHPCWDRDDTKCGPVIRAALGTDGKDSLVSAAVKGGLAKINVKGLPDPKDVEEHYVYLDTQAGYWIAGPELPGPYWDQAGVNARRSLGELIDDFENAVDAMNNAGYNL